MSFNFVRFLSAGLLLLVSACCAAWAGGVTDSAPLKIVASNYPLAYFAERIGGNRVQVSLPVPADEDPSFWKPDAKAVGAMQKAGLILLNGADYEKWLPRVSLSKFKLADTSAGFKDRFIRIENAVTHSHGPGGMHSHDGHANNTWLDFDQASQQAGAVAEAMARKRPELKAEFLENLKPLQAELAGLDAQLKSLVAAKPGLPLLGSHPIYQYLARRYGLNLKSVHWEPNEMPAPAEWVGLRKILASHPAQWMIWESEPSQEINSKLQAEGVKTLAFEPAANRPESGDFMTVMRRNVDNLKEAFH